MNVRLDPPSVPPLRPAERALLRRRVMAASAPAVRTRRRWAAPLVAVAAVGAVITGTLVAVDQLRPAEPPAATPPPASSIDRGPLTPADEAAAAKTCPGLKGAGAEVLWSRNVFFGDPAGKAMYGRGAEGNDRVQPLVLFKGKPSPTHPDARLGMYLCTPDGAYVINDDHWTEPLTPATGHAALTGKGVDTLNHPDKGGFALGVTFLRVRPEITRAQARLVWNNGKNAGPWVDTVVAVDGFAYVSLSTAIPVGQQPQVTTNDKDEATIDRELELRAFDAAGKPVPMPVPR